MWKFEVRNGELIYVHEKMVDGMDVLKKEKGIHVILSRLNSHIRSSLSDFTLVCPCVMSK